MKIISELGEQMLESKWVTEWPFRILANIDVTNSCNQACPVCFANASASGYLYEPSLTQIRAMMQMRRNEKPVSCPAVQFAD
jgi:uncharacterized radical SAM superfamily Fe-S cluster-containing enzyme